MTARATSALIQPAFWRAAPAAPESPSTQPASTSQATARITGPASQYRNSTPSGVTMRSVFGSSGIVQSRSAEEEGKRKQLQRAESDLQRVRHQRLVILRE